MTHVIQCIVQSPTTTLVSTFGRGGYVCCKLCKNKSLITAFCFLYLYVIVCVRTQDFNVEFYSQPSLYLNQMLKSFHKYQKYLSIYQWHHFVHLSVLGLSDSHITQPLFMESLGHCSKSPTIDFQWLSPAEHCVPVQFC